MLRVWAAHRNGSPSFDESFTVMAARLPLRDLPGWLRSHDSHPPLDYLLRMPVAHTSSEWWLRLPSLAISAVMLVGLSAWARRRATVEAFIMSAVLAISPFAVHYGVEARLYALALALGAALLIVCVAWIERPRRWHPVVMGLTLLTLAFTISTWPIAALVVLAVAGARTDAVAWRWRAAAALAVAVWLPAWGLAWRDQLGGGHASWVPTTGLQSLSGVLAAVLTLKVWPVTAVGALVMIGVVLLAWPDRREPLARVALVTVGLATGTIAVAGVGSHVVIARAVTLAVPAMAALAGVAGQRLLAASRTFGPATLALVGALMVGSLGAAVQPSDGVAAQHLLARAGRGDVVATYPDWFFPLAGWRAGPASRLPALRVTPDVEGFRLAGRATGRVWVTWPDSYAFAAPDGWRSCSQVVADGHWRLGCWRKPS